MYLNYINNLRGLAIIFIVAAHCIYLNFMQWDAVSLTPRIINTFFELSSTLFIFISGFLFQYLSHKYTFKRYITSKLKFVILPYILVSIPAIVKILYFPFADDVQLFQEYSKPIQVLAYYATGNHMGALWFIPALTFFYLLAPLLFILDKKRFFYWLLPLFFIVSVLVPREITPIHNPLQSMVHFFSIYVLGMFVSHHREKIFPYISKFSWLLVSFIIIFFAIELYYSLVLYNNFVSATANLFRWAISALLFSYLFKIYDQKMRNILSVPAEMSFGIYFVHGYTLTFIQKMFSYFNLSLDGSIITFLAVLILTLFLSMLGLWVVKKIVGKRSRMLVGY